MKTTPIARHRPFAGLAAGAALLLAVTACGPDAGSAESTAAGPTAPTGSPSATAADSAASAPDTNTPSTTAGSTTASTSPAAVAPTASPTTPGATASDPARDAGARGEAFTSSTGMISLSIPKGWTVEQVDLDALDPRPIGMHDVYRITDKDDDITVYLESHYGEKDNDGPRPELLGALAAEEIPALSSFHDDSEAYFLAYHLGPSEYVEMPHEVLSVQVADVPDSVDPRSQEAFWGAWLQLLTQDPTGYVGGTVLQTAIPLPMVEALTGETGEDAMQAFLETTEHRELKQMMMSYTVHEDKIPDSLPGL
jgi:hypothetical protein